MIDANRLTITSIRGDGIESRWAGDAADAKDVFSGLTITTKEGAGFATARCTLPRKLVGDDFDLNPLDLIVIEGPGGEVAFEGRQADLPRQSGAEATVDMEAVGRSTELLYDTTFREVYVDRAFDSWTEPDPARLQTIKASNNPYGTDYQMKVNDRGLHFEGTSRKEIENGSGVEAWYRMPAGCEGSRIDYDLVNSHPTDTENAAVFAQDSLTATGTSYVLTVGTNQTTVITNPKRYLMLRLRSNNLHTKVAGQSAHRAYPEMVVYGNSGVTLHDIPSGTNAAGVKAESVIRDVLDRAAPLLNYTDESIAATDFIIPHLTFPEPTTADAVIQAVNEFHRYSWGVYEGGVFYWRPAEAYRRRWGLRVEQGDIADAGPQAESVVNGVIVSYTDPNDNAKMAGPVGSGADVTDSGLAIIDPENAVNAHGIPVKYDLLEVGPKTTDLGAIQLGIRRAAELQTKPYRGSFNAVGSVLDIETGIEWPSWCVRAGDSVTLLPADPADALGDEHRITETSFEYDSLTNALTIDDASFRLSALISRLEAVTA